VAKESVQQVNQLKAKFYQKEESKDDLSYGGYDNSD
jgi:hypothetical protein